MSAELCGQVPGIEFPFATTLVNRAWREVQRAYLWSFLYGLWAIPTLVPVTGGTVTTSPNQNTVVGDATASAAWQAISNVTPIGSLQFRIGTGTIYDIVNFDGVSTLTLGQPFVDPGAGAGLGYQIQSSYFSPPVSDFLWFESLTDPVTGYDIDIDTLREYADQKDPQRIQPGWPYAAIPYGINMYSTSSYYGFPRIELWPLPTVGYTYTGTYFRSGSDFASLSDTVNPMLGEDVVMAKAKYYAYEWKAANSGNSKRLGSSVVANYGASGTAYLMSQADKQYQALLNTYILKDETFSKRHVLNGPSQGFLSTLPWVSQQTNLAHFP